MSILDRFKLDGKTALVTGARRGIGRAMAAALAEAGADIIGASKSLEPEGSEVEKIVRATGRNFRGYQCDFASREAVHGFVSQLGADGVVDESAVGAIQDKPRAFTEPLFRQLDGLMMNEHRHVLLGAQAYHFPQRGFVDGVRILVWDTV